MTDTKDENIATVPDDTNDGLHNRKPRQLSTLSKRYDIDGDGKLDDVELAMRKMDSGNLGYLSNEKVHKIMVEQLELQKAVFSLKRIGLVLFGLVIVLALSTLGTSFAAAKLAQDMKTSSTGNLVSTKTGEIVGTQAHGSQVPITFSQAFIGRRRRHLLGKSTPEDRRLAGSVLATVSAADVAQAWRDLTADSTPISVTGTFDDIQYTAQVAPTTLSRSIVGDVTRYLNIHTVDAPKPSYDIECTENETTCNVYKSVLQRVNLGLAADFAILAQAGVTTTGTTSVTGSIGVSPIALASVTGFALTADTSNTYSTSPLVTNGRVYGSNQVSPTPGYLGTAVSDVMAAYTDAAGRLVPDELNRGGAAVTGTFAHGLYKWTSATVSLPTDITFEGSDTDIWIMQIAGALTVTQNVKVTLAGGAKAENIFWQVAGAITVSAGAHLEGIFLTSTAMNFLAGSSLNGAALAGTAVTLISATIVKSSA